MSYTQTTAQFAGGVEGLPFPGALASTTIAGVGTTLAGAPVLNGGINYVSAAAGQTAVALPTNWPLSAPLIVVNTSATAATVFPGTASQQFNVTAAGSAFSVAANKAAVFWYAGTNAAGAGQWVAVGGA